MRKFIADDQLIELFCKNGLIETTSEVDRKKTKKSFELNSNSKKRILFDYKYITVISDGYILASRIELNEVELKSLLFYMKLTKTDVNEIFGFCSFDFENVDNRITTLEKELNLLRTLSKNSKRQKKLSRILDTFVEIKLN